MKRARALAPALLLVAALGGHTSTRAAEAEAVFSRASPAVWTVKAELGPGKAAIGSAVAVLPDLLVTACHVVGSATQITISQKGTQAPIGRVTRDPDPARDLCVLSTDTPVQLATVEIAPIDSVRVGQRVYAIGSPNGLELTLSEGLVSALRPKSPGELPAIQTSAAISSGSSGGGLFDGSGRLVGVTDNISPGGENLGFAYPAQWLVELPQRIEAERAKWRELLPRVGVPVTPNGEVKASGYADLKNTDRLPDVGIDPGQLRIAYQQFLLQARPRAFIITGDLKYGTATRASDLTAHIQGCAERKVTCAVYAVDDTVVWGTQKR
ncbi:MAG TPA: S1C family serine protease [Burkholderiaceae bacterium]|nr:S1C family serine protease [Burkholderiaceae bacterium]